MIRFDQGNKNKIKMYRKAFFVHLSIFLMMLMRNFSITIWKTRCYRYTTFLHHPKTQSPCSAAFCLQHLQTRQLGHLQPYFSPLIDHDSSLYCQKSKSFSNFASLLSILILLPHKPCYNVLNVCIYRIFLIIFQALLMVL